jgi:hypothetical protein
MPITINGTGTVTGISAGGLPDACITTDDIAANAVTSAKLGADQASGLAKAWVNFNGTGTVAIRASFNVSSITDTGTAEYTVNFTTAMTDANYSVNITSMRPDDHPLFGSIRGNATYSSVFATSSVRIGCYNYDALLNVDPLAVTVAIFR